MSDKLRNSLKRNFYLRDERDLLDKQIALLKENNYPPEEIQALEKQRAVVEEAFKKGTYDSAEPETIGQKSYDYFYEPSRDVWDKFNRTYPDGADGERMRQYDNRQDMIAKVNNGTYTIDDYKNAAYKTIPQITPLPKTNQQIPQQNSAPQESGFWTLENAKKYLNLAKQLGYTAINGYSMGYLDELYGAVESGAYGATEAFLKAFAGYKPKESTWNSMKETYVQGRDEMRGELQQFKEEYPTLSNIADATGSALSPSVFSKGKRFDVIQNIRYPSFNSLSYGTVGSIAKNQAANAVTNGVLSGIGNSEENTLSEYAQNIGKNVAENLITNKIGNKMFGRNLGRSLERTVLDTSTNFGIDNLEDVLRKK